MKLPASFTKAEEIQILEALGSSDSYFHEFFASEVDQMASNIKNDFPIEHGTKMEDWRLLLIDSRAKVATLENELQANIAEISHKDAEIADLKNRLRKILGNMVVAQSDNMVMVPENHFQFSEVLRSRLTNEVKLNEEETEYLLSKIDE